MLSFFATFCHFPVVLLAKQQEEQVVFFSLLNNYCGIAS